VATPPCICLDIFVDAVCGDVDRESWKAEYEQHVRYGHVASCNYQPAPRPPRRLRDDHQFRLAPEPTTHRGLARILDDLMNNPELMELLSTE
jgi:hypothetical protein